MRKLTESRLASLFIAVGIAWTIGTSAGSAEEPLVSVVTEVTSTSTRGRSR